MTRLQSQVTARDRPNLAVGRHEASEHGPDDGRNAVPHGTQFRLVVLGPVGDWLRVGHGLYPAVTLGRRNTIDREPAALPGPQVRGSPRSPVPDPRPMCFVLFLPSVQQTRSIWNQER